MRPILYNVHNDPDTDSFGVSDDYETALSRAQEAARERPGETILITYKGWAIRNLHLTPDGKVAEEHIMSPEEVDERLRAITPSWVGKQQP